MARSRPQHLRLARVAGAMLVSLLPNLGLAADPPWPATWATCEPRLTPFAPQRAACLTRLEAAALSEGPGSPAATRRSQPWSRTAAELRLTWADAPPRVWTDAPPTGERVSLLGRLTGGLWVLLHEQPGRRPVYELVNTAAPAGRSSPSWTVPSLPVPSPDGRWLVMVDDGHGRGPAVVALWQRLAVGGTETGTPAAVRWQQVWRYEPPAGVSHRFERWRPDGAALQLRWWHARATPGCPREGQVQLRDGPYGWDLYPAATPECPR